jgi:hypothetical protein
MILVFGGVVLVWSHLIDFLKDILMRYPQVKDDLSQKKALEQILIRYISNIPKTEVLNAVVTDDLNQTDNHDEESGKSKLGQERSRAHARAGKVKNNKIDSNTIRKNIQDKDAHYSALTTSKSTSDLSPASEGFTRVLDSRRPNYCFFCLKSSPSYLIPACSAWNPKSPSSDSLSKEIETNPIHMCTPYTQLALTRDELNINIHNLKNMNLKLETQVTDLNSNLAISKTTIDDLQAKFNKSEACLLEMKRSFEIQLNLLKEQKERDVQDVISQHNAQLAELKRIHKTLHTRHLITMQQIKYQLSLGNQTSLDRKSESSSFETFKSDPNLESSQNQLKSTHKKSNSADKLKDKESSIKNVKSVNKEPKALSSKTDFKNIISQVKLVTKTEIPNDLSQQSSDSHESLISLNTDFNDLFFEQSSMDDLNR